MKYFQMPKTIIDKHRDAFAAKILEDLKELRNEYRGRKAYTEYLDCLINEDLEKSVVVLPVKGLVNIVRAIDNVQRRHPRTSWVELRRDLGAIFNYTSMFVNGTDWNTGKYIEMMRDAGFEKCPYCNETDVIVTDKDEEGMQNKDPLDHFYGQTEYPFLALSIYNLIPVCEFCNKRKNSFGAGLDTYTHPFKDDFHTLVKFKLDDDAWRSFLKGSITIGRIKLVSLKKSRSPMAIKLSRSVRMVGRYNGVRSAARKAATDTLENCQKYRAASIQWFKDYAHLFKKPLDKAFEHLMKVSMDGSDINCQQCGKLRYDLIPREIRRAIKAELAKEG